MGDVAALVYRWAGVVAMDYGQFQLSVPPGIGGRSAESDAIDDMAVLNAALHGTGVAQYGPMVTIVSPHQNNFAMPLQVEVWDRALPDALDDWEESFEIWFDVDASGLMFGSPTLENTVIAVPPGRYRGLITGRGFSASGWPGSTQPGDQWRIRLTPDQWFGEPAHLRMSEYARHPVGLAGPVTPKEGLADHAAPSEQHNTRTRERELLIERSLWGGVAPSDQLRALGVTAATVAGADRPLADWLAAQAPTVQRRVAVWAARKACANAGPGPLNWDDALLALDAGTNLPTPFNDPNAVWRRLYLSTTAYLVLSKSTAPDSPTPTRRSPIDPPAAAVATIAAANHDQPAIAAFGALGQAASAYHHPNELYAELRGQFLDTRPAGPNQ